MNCFGVRLANADLQPRCDSLNGAGYFFNPYVNVEYINNLLAFHLKVLNPYNDGRGWNNSLVLFTPNCLGPTTLDNPLGKIELPAGLNNYSIRFSSISHWDVWNDETDTKIICDACSVDIPSPQTAESWDSIEFASHIDGYASFLYTGSYPIHSPAPPTIPVLIVPGILGTEIFDQSGNKLWLDPVRIALSDATFMDNLTSANDKIGNVIDKVNYVFGDYHYSDLLVKQFTDQGYTLDKDLFLFPYDWRNSISGTEVLLKTKIDSILSASSAGKINIIAHSMGGLIIKQYLSKEDVANKINNVVLVGTPNLGTAQAAKALIFGDNLGIPLLNSDEIYKLAQAMPSIYDLLPSQEYFNHIPGFYDDLVNIKTPQILNYTQSQNMLIDLGKRVTLLNQAELDHSMDNYDFTTKDYKVFNVVSCGLFTVKTINKMYAGEPNLIQRAFWGPKYRIYGESGDGSVLAQSAAYIKNDPNNTFYVDSVDHSKLLSDDKTRADIYALATSAQLADTNLSNSNSSCALQGKLLSFSSSMEIDITDALTGKKLQPGVDYTVQKTANDQHVFLNTKSGKKYNVTAKSDAATTKTTASITNIGTQNQNKITNNYNDVILNGAVISINLDGQGQSVDTVDGTDVKEILPSQTTDENYIPISGDTTLPGDTSVDAPPPVTVAPITMPAQSAPEVIANTVPVDSNQDPSATDTSVDDTGNSDTSQVATSDSSPANPVGLNINVSEPEPKIIYINPQPNLPNHDSVQVALPPVPNITYVQNFDYSLLAHTTTLGTILIKLLHLIFF